MRRKNIKAKIKQKYGCGIGKDYKPFIRTSEFNSLGTCSNIKDWKTGRTVHLLSKGEELLWYLLRWDDENLDIQEQFPLDLNETINIALDNGITHPRFKRELSVMTTDFLVTKQNEKIAYSLKTNQAEVSKNTRTLEKLYIEKIYWVKHNVRYKLVFKEDLSQIFVTNIRRVVIFYNIDDVFDDVTFFMHLIANKKVRVDLKSEIVNFKELYINNYNYIKYERISL